MKYEKPEMTLVTSAVKAVKGTAKGMGSADVLPSNPAYEADE
jgi:hypothetical protein